MSKPILFHNLINEILAENLESYPFLEDDITFDEEDGGLLNVEYSFNTPENQYRVNFYSGEYNPSDKTFEVSFGINRGPTNQPDMNKMTGENNTRSILKTISEIIIEFMEDFEEDVKRLIVKPTSEKRGRIYKTLLPKYLPQNILHLISFK